MKGDQSVRNESVSVSATSTQIAPKRPLNLRRTQVIIINTSAAAIVTIAKGEVSAVANNGIRLLPNGSYAEATDGGYTCWNGAIQAISDIAGTISITENFIED